MELYIVALVNGNRIYGNTGKTYKTLTKAKEACDKQNQKEIFIDGSGYKVLKAEWYPVKELE